SHGEATDLSAELKFHIFHGAHTFHDEHQAIRWIVIIRTKKGQNRVQLRLAKKRSTNNEKTISNNLNGRYLLADSLQQRSLKPNANTRSQLDQNASSGNIRSRDHTDRRCPANALPHPDCFGYDRTDRDPRQHPARHLTAHR